MIGNVLGHDAPPPVMEDEAVETAVAPKRTRAPAPPVQEAQAPADEAPADEAAADDAEETGSVEAPPPPEGATKAPPTSLVPQ